jgi:hypothetical protein
LPRILLIKLVRSALERAVLVKFLAENTQNSEKWRVNSAAREFATFFQLPEAVSTRFMFCREGNLAGQ